MQLMSIILVCNWCPLSVWNLGWLTEICECCFQATPDEAYNVTHTMLCIMWLYVQNIVVYFLECENKWSEVVNWDLKTLSSQIKLFLEQEYTIFHTTIFWKLVVSKQFWNFWEESGIAKWGLYCKNLAYILCNKSIILCIYQNFLHMHSSF